MVDDDNNQMVAFTTAKWVNTIENGDRVSIIGIVKNHNKTAYTRAYTINDDKYQIEKVSKSGNTYYEIDYDKALKDGHSLGFSFPDHIEEEMNIEKVRGIYEINQTQLTRVKLIKEVA